MVVNLEIYELRKTDENAWDEYVSKSNSSTFYHLIGWKNVVQKTYTHKPHYLIAKENGEIKGILPLFLMKSVFFGNKFVSVPFAPYGGVCADNEIIENALIDEAKRITKYYNADYLEFRNIDKKDSNLIEKSLQVTSLLYLDTDPDIIWKKMKRDKKRGINKAKKANIEIIWNNGRINDFYNLYAQSMRYLGTPVHSINFFRNIIQEFPDNINLVMSKHNDRVIGCILLLFFKDTVISGWSASHRKYLNLHPNDLAYWEAIKYCCEKGYKIFDFGRSIPGSGVHEFKRSYGSETKYLHYQYYLNNINKIPNITVLDAKRKKFAKLWRKMPNPLTNRIGPLLRSNFP